MQNLIGHSLWKSQSQLTARNPNSKFIIDPIDGTTNFMHGNPNFAISIAAEIDNKLEAALIYSPITDEMFLAERGKGAFLNDKRIRVASRKKLSESILITGIPHLGRGDIDLFYKRNENLNSRGGRNKTIRLCGPRPSLDSCGPV